MTKIDVTKSTVQTPLDPSDGSSVVVAKTYATAVVAPALLSVSKTYATAVMVPPNLRRSVSPMRIGPAGS